MKQRHDALIAPWRCGKRVKKRNASLRFAIAGTIGEEFLMDGQV
jgi:hypothetical protein